MYISLCTKAFIGYNESLFRIHKKEERPFLHLERTSLFIKIFTGDQARISERT